MSVQLEAIAVTRMLCATIQRETMSVSARVDTLEMVRSVQVIKTECTSRELRLSCVVYLSICKKVGYLNVYYSCIP